MTCISSAVKCLSVLLVALSVIFLINFAIISLLSDVEPSCYYHGDYWSESRYAINVWEGLWIPIPSFVTGIVGLTTACGPSQCKKIFLLILSILTTLFNLSAFAPLIVSFLDVVLDDRYYLSSDCPEFMQRSSYLLIQMGLVFFLSATTFSLSILTCLYKPALKTNQGTILPSAQFVGGSGQQQQPTVYMMQQQPFQPLQQQQQYQAQQPLQQQQYEQHQQQQPPRPQVDAQPVSHALPRAQPPPYKE